MRKIVSFSTLAAMAITLGVATSFGAREAKADSCVQPGNRNVTAHCYYLPTVNNGRITGLEQEKSYTFNGRGPYGGHGGSGGAVIGHGGGYAGPPYLAPKNCRDLPTIVDGRVTGVHQVCG